MATKRFGTQIRLLLLSVLLVVTACGSGGGSGGRGTVYPMSGRALKGPFAIGSQISVNEQNASLSPTGKVYNVQTSDYLGNFSVPSGVGTNLVEIVADGFYMNELTGQLSSAAISLTAVADLTVSATPTVNALTTLQEPRLKALMSKGMTYAAANTQSQTEVLAAFGIDSTKIKSLSTFYSMQINGSADADSVLLATSAILSQMATDAATANGTTQPAELSNYVNTIAAQLATSGTVTSSSFATARNLAEAEISLSAVRSNVETYYAKYGVTMVAPKFEEWIDLTGAGVVPQRLVPVTGLSFTDVSGASPGQLVTSNVVTLSGLGSGVIAPVAVNTGTTVIKNNVAITGNYAEALDGDTIALRVTSPGYDVSNAATVSVGSSSATWHVTSAALGGLITGLTSNGLVLQVNGANNISVAAGSTSFSFPVAIANGTAYSVSVLTQPGSPQEFCDVRNGTGTVGAAPSNITLGCGTPLGWVFVTRVDGGSPDPQTGHPGGSVSGFAIESATGALAPIAGSPFPEGRVANCVAVDPGGKFVFATSNKDTAVWAYTIAPTTGTLTQIGVFSTGTGLGSLPRGIAVTGKFAYVADDFTSDAVGNFIGPVSGFTIDATTGALSPIAGSPFSVGGDATAVATTLNGNFLYVQSDIQQGTTLTQAIYAFSIDATTGALTPVPGSPWALPAGTAFLGLHPTGKFIYLSLSGVGNNLGQVMVYAVNPMTGALTVLGTSAATASSFPGGIAFDPTGKFAYVTDVPDLVQRGNTVSAYTIDATTGALTPIVGSPFAAGSWPGSVSVDPTGRFLFEVDTGVNTPTTGAVSAFSINTTTGALTPVPGSPFAAGQSPGGIATTLFH
jgi:6-phosphogluconolactonase (cycloisomerase 2 family)